MLAFGGRTTIDDRFIHEEVCATPRLRRGSFDVMRRNVLHRINAVIDCKVEPRKGSKQSKLHILSKRRVSYFTCWRSTSKGFQLSIIELPCCKADDLGRVPVVHNRFCVHYLIFMFLHKKAILVCK